MGKNYIDSLKLDLSLHRDLLFFYLWQCKLHTMLFLIHEMKDV